MSYLAEKIKRTDADNIEDCIVQIEKSFAIKFNSEDLNKFNSFQELAALTCETILGENRDSCTSQQAFYKFRKAYFATQNSNITITPNSSLDELFPKENRRKQIQILEQEIGFKTNILEPATWIILSLLGLFISSCIMLLFNTFYGISGILLAILGFFIAAKFGNELSFHHVSDLVKSMEQENYMKCRSTHSYNSKEVEKRITQIFTENLDLDSSKFDSNTAFS